MCLYPKIILNRKYIPNNKNGGHAPPVFDHRTLYIPAGCGNCIECRTQYARSWQARLTEEIKSKDNKYFITLTFDEENLHKLENELTETWNNIIENDIATTAVRRFLEVWRKHNGKSVKHWLITELGHKNTERIHLHGIIWCNDLTEIAYRWKYGIVHIGKYVNQKTINYIIKYVTKIDKDHKGYKPKILTSPGIGKNYLNKIDSKLNKYNGNKTREYYLTPQGIKINLPKYYKNKIYTEEEKEQLWINKLNSNYRYICGEKVNTDDENTLYKSLQYYQRKNKRLGYGNDEEEWTVREYKKQRQKLKMILNKKRHS